MFATFKPSAEILSRLHRQTVLSRRAGEQRLHAAPARRSRTQLQTFEATLDVF